MTESNIRYLVQRVLRNQCSPEEKEALAAWIVKSENDTRLKNLLEEAWKDFESSEIMPDHKAEAMLAAILGNKEIEDEGGFNSSTPVIWRRLSVAAILITLIGIGSYFIFFNNPVPEVAKLEKVPVPVYNDAHPGKKKAELTLADGSKIALGEVADGNIAQQGDIQVISSRGVLIYSGTAMAPSTGADSKASTLLYNTLNTHRGELYPLNLSDGSKVWLNSSSSIRFPAAFAATERVVEITGEAYFEVAKNPAKPFLVMKNGMKIEVLGTHFNVNAYPEESVIKTTLIEGALRVSKGNSSILLAPEQQANLKENGDIVLVKKIDVEEAVSWIDGYFHFNNASLQTVMRQLSRWYDVDVVYENKDTTQHFEGDFEKSLNLSQVLFMMKESKVHFKIEGKKLIVLP